MIRHDWRINPQEQSLEPPNDDEPDPVEQMAAERDHVRREDEEVDDFMEGRNGKRTVLPSKTNGGSAQGNTRRRAEF